MPDPDYRLLSAGNIETLLSKYADPGGKVRVDLGCGFYKPAGFIGIDNFAGSAAQIPDGGNLPDIVMDLNRCRTPLPDGCCVEVRASHFLEHSDLDRTFEEVHRLLDPEGVFLFVVPYANSAEGMYPGHSIFLTEKFFHNNLKFQRLFRILTEEYKPSEDYAALPEAVRRQLPPFDLARKFLFNVCSEMTITAAPVK
jgi:SAM-dependent methyltransferase